MKIQPMGKAFKMTTYVYANGWGPAAAADWMYRTVQRLRRELGADEDPEETSRRALIYQESSF